MTDTQLLTWRPTTHLPGGLHLRTADLHTQLTAGQIRATALHGCIYAISGYDHTKSLWAGYIGVSNALKPGRAWRSYTNWTRAISAFQVGTIALVTSDHQLDDDQLRVSESRVIRNLSSRIYLYNSQVSARESTRRLADRANAAATIGDDLARALATAVFTHTNPMDSPAHTHRESAVRTVLSADRALSVDEILERLAAMGVSVSGATPARTVRRDLTVRELDTAGKPRILTGYRRGRTVYWRATLPAATALARYDAVHPRPAQQT